MKTLAQQMEELQATLESKDGGPVLFLIDGVTGLEDLKTQYEERTATSLTLPAFVAAMIGLTYICVTTVKGSDILKLMASQGTVNTN